MVNTGSYPEFCDITGGYCQAQCVAAGKDNISPAPGRPGYPRTGQMTLAWIEKEHRSFGGNPGQHPCGEVGRIPGSVEPGKSVYRIKVVPTSAEGIPIAVSNIYLQSRIRRFPVTGSPSKEIDTVPGSVFLVDNFAPPGEYIFPGRMRKGFDDDNRCRSVFPESPGAAEEKILEYRTTGFRGDIGGDKVERFFPRPGKEKARFDILRFQAVFSQVQTGKGQGKGVPVLENDAEAGIMFFQAAADDTRTAAGIKHPSAVRYGELRQVLQQKPGTGIHGETREKSLGEVKGELFSVVPEGDRPEYKGSFWEL